MDTATDGAGKGRERNKELANTWLAEIAGNLTGEEATTALADLVCWIALLGGKITLEDLTKELIRRS